MKRLKSFLCGCFKIICGLILCSLLLVIIHKFVPVYYTPLMFFRSMDQKGADTTPKKSHQWVSIDQMAQPMIQAVVASEDNLFMSHYGFDREQIEEAIQKNKEKKKSGKGGLRGASTISQQTAKNVYLWPQRSYFRKAVEAYFTLLIELIWGKERIMEVYLNSIEMGNGIYGVEAASQAYFNKPAVQLTASEAALLAASLPNPRKRNPKMPSEYMRRRQMEILSLMSKIEPIPMGYDHR